ncbi:o-succinylbenzoate synthase [Dermabacter hominis]|uniref:o-succinylbenzoate synthase n=1 Tax=Dermabacter hominis TaxID=36740 RepID=UPI0021A6979F|nr:o-succinylbenzoate synthase [Dermabacter hominis]MCT1717308.1 o-succinylbenzoate synthase [Dermabacter hominis]MCT1790566.1 o-succinylbenzoate synthase [Dermabacter hominis]
MQFEGRIERIEIVRIPMRTRFRGIDVREAALLLGPEGWGEFSPFLEYGPEEASAWLAAALEQATLPFPEPLRPCIPINATIPVVSPERAYALARSFGAATAKVKVSDASCTHSDDLARVAAVREALGDEARIRVDANASWVVREAIEKIRELDRAAGGLEYVEQPCASVRELAEVRRSVHVKIAADESVRKAEDPLAVARAKAADILVMKAQPLGGVRRALALAEQAGLPVVVSSALETSVGLSAGLAFAAALPELEHACGLGTARLLEGDVCERPLVSDDGTLPAGRIDVSEEFIEKYRASESRAREWHVRIAQAAEVLEARTR